MFLVYLSLIVGCLVYMVRIWMEFRSFHLEMSQRIEELDRKWRKLAAQIEAEMPSLEVLKARVESFRENREEVMKQIEEVKTTLLIQKMENEALSIDVQKLEFRSRLRKGRRRPK